VFEPKKKAGKTFPASSFLVSSSIQNGFGFVALNSAAVDVSDSIHPDFFVLVHLDNPAILYYQGYCAKADRFESVAHDPFQVAVPLFRLYDCHIRSPQAVFQMQ
jgi:hypothetical protein